MFSVKFSARGAGVVPGILRVAPAHSDLNALVASMLPKTAEGKLAEPGQKLEELKRAIEKLNTRQR
jgi:hypothetical protein